MHASILLRDRSNRTRGWLFFRGDDQALPMANEVSPGNAVVYLYKHISEFGNVADTLRNEKPITLWFENSSRVIVATSQEPGGEEES